MNREQTNSGNNLLPYCDLKKRKEVAGGTEKRHNKAGIN